MKKRNLVICFQLSFHIHLYLYTYLAPVSVSQVVAGVIRLQKKRLQKNFVLRRLYPLTSLFLSVKKGVSKLATALEFLGPFEECHFFGNSDNLCVREVCANSFKHCLLDA